MKASPESQKEKKMFQMGSSPVVEPPLIARRNVSPKVQTFPIADGQIVLTISNRVLQSLVVTRGGKPHCFPVEEPNVKARARKFLLDLGVAETMVETVTKVL